MKRCGYCGKDFSDEFEFCPTDSTPLKNPNEPEIASLGPIIKPPVQIISPEEQRFWERMGFRGFAIFWIRVQALWLFFYAVLGTFNLAADFFRISIVPTFSQKMSIFIELLRIILYVASGLALILHAECIITWIIKDLIIKPPSDERR